MGDKAVSHPLRTDAFGLTKEAAFERQKGFLDQIAHLVEDANNRLTVHSGDLSERYIQGRLEICLKFRPHVGGRQFHAVIKAAPERVGIKNQSNTGYDFGDPVPIWSGESGRALHSLVPFCVEVFAAPGADSSPKSFVKGEPLDNQRACSQDVHQVRSVLVRVFEVVECSQEGAFAAIEWLRLGEGYSNVRRDLFRFREVGFEILPVLTEDEGAARFALVPVPPNGADGLVEWLAQRSQNSTDLRIERIRERFGDLDAPNLDWLYTGAVRLYVGNKFIWFRCDKCFDLSVELIDLGYGPFNLSKRSDKRFRVHHISRPTKGQFAIYSTGATQKDSIVMPASKDQDEARLEMLAKRLLATPHKPREESVKSKSRAQLRQSRNRKDKRAKRA